MIEKRLKALWENLQGKKPHMPHYLTQDITREQIENGGIGPVPGAFNVAG